MSQITQDELDGRLARTAYLGSETRGITSGRQLATQSNGQPSLGIRLSSVKREPIEWLWRHRIPLGKLTLVDGDPGLGKSLMTLDLASRITRGDKLPDGSPGLKGGVVLLSAEDGLGDTIRPRLEAAGADLDRVLSLATIRKPDGGDRVAAIPDDLQVIVNAVKEVGAVLVVIDPLMAFLGRDTNSNRDHDVRRALAPVAIAADKFKFALLVVRHLNKATATANPLYRGGGSIAFIGAARAGMVVAEDPDDKDRRVVAPTKSNLGPRPTSLAFHIETADDVPHIVWDGASEYLAETLLVQTSAEEHGQRAAAKQFLLEALRDGAVESDRLKSQAEAMDIKWRTVWRAKSQLGIVARKLGYQGSWTWELPKIATV